MLMHLYDYSLIMMLILLEYKFLGHHEKMITMKNKPTNKITKQDERSGHVDHEHGDNGQ